MLIRSLERQGDWFFRWRSYVLLGFVPLGIVAILDPMPLRDWFGPAGVSVWRLFCVLLALAGLAFRAWTIGHVPARTSGRNAVRQVADALNTTGAYSVTRNPLYFGNAVTYVAVALFTQNLWFAAVMALFLVYYLERIIAAEERFLAGKFGAAWSDWAAGVPPFFPGFSAYVAPALPFSWKTVLKREYHGALALATVLIAMVMATDFVATGGIVVRPLWIAAWVAAALFYGVMRYLKLRTTTLDVEGRG
ncbi:MAG: isoprenylcysteine carboxylmethyltransferase family protein [Rhizobiaceae bacterium]